MKDEEMNELLSGYLDGELTQQQNQQVRIQLESSEELRNLHDQLVLLKKNMGELSYPETDLKALKEMENDLVSRGGQWLGWGLMLLALFLMLSKGLYEIFTADEVPWWTQLSTAGFVVLFLVVLRQRLRTYKNDKYRKVRL